MARYPRLILLLAVSLLVPFVRQAPALADVDITCGQEDGIFWGAVWWDGSNYHWRTFDYGDYGLVKVSDRDLNEACGTLTNLAGGTTNILKDVSATAWVEVGYDEGWNSNKSGHVFEWFVEIGGSPGTAFRTDGGWGGWPCTFPGPNNWIGLRATQVIGTFNWNFKVNCQDGSGDHNVQTNKPAIFSGGVPTVETWRRGGSKTGMSDDHQDLDYRPGNYSTWTNWTGGLCVEDFASSGTNNWNGSMFSATEYRTYKSGIAYCPQP